MAARLTRLIGFIIIITDLGWTGINIVETWSLWAMLSIALGKIYCHFHVLHHYQTLIDAAFNFAFNATNTGSTRYVLRPSWRLPTYQIPSEISQILTPYTVTADST